LTLAVFALRGRHFETGSGNKSLSADFNIY
jgi:hypothetical protein